MFQEKVYHDSVAFSSSRQDVKLLVIESSISSYLVTVVESSSNQVTIILVTVSTSSYFERIS